MEKQPDYTLIDEALSPFSDLMQAFLQIQGTMEDENTGLKMEVDQIRVNMPVELDVYLDDANQVVLGSAPPTIHVETAYPLVLHTMTFTFDTKQYENSGQ